MICLSSVLRYIYLSTSISVCIGISCVYMCMYRDVCVCNIKVAAKFGRSVISKGSKIERKGFHNINTMQLNRLVFF